MAERPNDELPVIDTSMPHPARVYNYLLGGKDNFAPDRALADAMESSVPGLRTMIAANRDFMGRVVRYLAADAGIRQFLDIGTGIPAAGPVHEIAQGIEPSSRVLYVDNEPIVLAHAKALMSRTEAGRTAFILGDFLAPDTIRSDPAFAATLDLAEPTALLMISLLMYFSDDDAYRTVADLLAALPSGSYVALSHPTGDFDPEPARIAVESARRGGLTYNVRSRDEVQRFFTGLEMVDPGVVPMLSWRPEGAEHLDPRSVFYWVGVGRKP